MEALHLSTEAEKKEINILSISLKQKDAEIDRLKELTGYDSALFFVCFVFLFICNLNEGFEKCFQRGRLSRRTVQGCPKLAVLLCSCTELEGKEQGHIFHYLSER